MTESLLFLGGVGVMVGVLVMEHLLRPRCPACGLKRTVSEGEWDGLEFRQCLACEHRYEVDYRKEGES